MEQKYWTDLVSELLTLRSDSSPTTGIDAPDRYSGSPVRYRYLANAQFQASRNVMARKARCAKTISGTNRPIQRRIAHQRGPVPLLCPKRFATNQ